MDKRTIRRICHRARSFVAGTEGALLTETLIVVPVVTIFAVGILEFGNVFWQRHQVQVGVRDAARYWSRCRGTAPFDTCSQTIARNLAFYGNPEGTGGPRVVGWTEDADLEIAPALPPSNPDRDDLVTVTGTHTYTGSPLMRLLQIEAFAFSYTHEQRYIGW
ncbi:MAG: TadE/TadG family type IV pilus assembly protein [Paracoccaceae bacterium]|jgi:Flp pilus assembly protein TadG|nr:TadE/TadG family type IV pilus assembly protein [Paracoccaceae bacterium]